MNQAAVPQWESSCLVSVILRGVQSFFFLEKCLFSSAFLKRNKGVFPSSLVFVSLFSCYPFLFAKGTITFKKQKHCAWNSGWQREKPPSVPIFRWNFIMEENDDWTRCLATTYLGEKGKLVLVRWTERTNMKWNKRWKCPSAFETHGSI